MIDCVEVWPQLARVRVDSVKVEPELLLVRAVTKNVPRSCPGCGVAPRRVHSRHGRRVADERVGSRPVVIELSVRRLLRGNPGCGRVTFVEQVEALTERYQRRTPALRRPVETVAIALAGAAGARLLHPLGQQLSWTTVLNVLMRTPVPEPEEVPPVVGVDEFALLKGQKYATILTDAVTGRRLDVLVDREPATVTAWLKAPPGIRAVCRDGSNAFAKAITDAGRGIVQVADR
ncbi:transposase family protein [Streptomyces abyssomicinicus]|uniref:transposase family protein n=1 Tax=Streptomyces abyssomicinicus TaxID=574929 RepID=UPI00248370C5|nr:transposase family protein [Streptomyces abyssomicinicus]